MDGAAAGPFAGARARPRLSTPPSSGLGDGALSPEPHGGAEFLRARWLLSNPRGGGSTRAALGWQQAQQGPAVATAGEFRRPFHLVGLGFPFICIELFRSVLILLIRGRILLSNTIYLLE